MSIPEGWITRIPGNPPSYVNTVPREGKEPLITRFSNKQIYLPSEQAAFEREMFPPNTLTLGVTGWTSVPKHYAGRYGTSAEPGIYETLTTALLLDLALVLDREKIPLQLSHGASNVGVDAASLRAMDELQLQGTGFNCPKFMPYVEDNRRGGPVLVAESKEKYHELFAQYTNILLVTGGRDDAYYHDYLNRLRGKGYSICADVMQVVSEREISGTDTAPGEQERMHNAAAHIREKNSFGYSPLPRSYDCLAALTKLSVLSHAYTLLQMPRNDALLGTLETEYLHSRQNVTMTTLAQLEERIAKTKKEYLMM